MIFLHLRSGPDRRRRVLNDARTAELLTAPRRLYSPRLVRVLLEMLPVPQLVKNFPAFYGPQKFMAMFTKARHLALSCITSIQSESSQPISLTSIAGKSHLRLGLPSSLFPSCFSLDVCAGPHFCDLPSVTHTVPSSCLHHSDLTVYGSCSTAHFVQKATTKSELFFFLAAQCCNSVQYFVSGMEVCIFEAACLRGYSGPPRVF